MRPAPWIPSTEPDPISAQPVDQLEHHIDEGVDVLGAKRDRRRSDCCRLPTPELGRQSPHRYLTAGQIAYGTERAGPVTEDAVIGQTLSRYKILSKLGEGGMGEVYLAEDTELGRRVAVKVLPRALAGNADRLERFRREARAVAALNHPNIVTIFNVEEAGGRRLLVMEHIEGRSLDRLIPAHGMPLERVFEIAVPLADALAAAHEEGITHRDLKPANVMVTTDGTVKVLDFGRAAGRACHEAFLAHIAAS